MSLQNICPLCGQENHCMIDKMEHEHCWCETVKFSEEILESVPAHCSNQCICKKCLETLSVK